MTARRSPPQTKAAVAQSAWTLHRGDCLKVLRRCAGIDADLVYMDPPFNTGKRREHNGVGFDDSWPGAEEYIRFLRPRVEASLGAMGPDGSILVHCDWRTCHHVRMMLDELMGRENCVNHLIWSYGLGGSSPRRFARKHDDILFYARSERYFFEPPRVAATSNRMRGQTKKATDVIDVPSINNMARERIGYPTQKPLALLRMLVGACSPPGGLVIDPFCGSGTTLVAAVETGRRAIGIDINLRAIRIARGRFERVGERPRRPSPLPAA